MSRIIYTPQEPKFFKQKQKKRKKTWFITAGGLAALALLSLVFFYAANLGYWRIKFIGFSGLVAMDENKLREAVWRELGGKHFGLIPKDFYFLVDKNKLGADLQEKFFQLAEAKIFKKFPETVFVEVQERQLFGILCPKEENLFATTSTLIYSDRGCVFIDKKGVAYETAPRSSGYLIPKIEMDKNQFQPGAQLLDEKLVQKLERASEAFHLSVGSLLTGFQLFSKIPREFRATAPEGFQVFLNTDDDFQKVFGIFKTVLDEEIKEKRPFLEYADLRFGNKVFYKFKK